MTLDDIDVLVHDFIIKHDAYPSAIDFMHFPKSVCTSINDVVAHGIPNNKVLENGEYVNIDVVCYYKGHHGDNSGMVMIGDVHPDIVKLVSSIYMCIFFYRAKSLARLCSQRLRCVSLAPSLQRSEKSFSNSLILIFAIESTGTRMATE